MRVATYDEAWAAGFDAAARSARKAGRSQWNDFDWNEAVRTFERVYEPRALLCGCRTDGTMCEAHAPKAD